MVACSDDGDDGDDSATGSRSGAICRAVSRRNNAQATWFLYWRTTPGDPGAVTFVVD